ncbi:type II secretion system protein [Micavibrio aeruginosavorus]|uniref:type II secretion system protein n=1 Tax=Micavibrio aeruginosavorus TaxID=349221 RepID=UPI003F4A89B7
MNRQHKKCHSAQSGFTLIEMAISMMIIGLLISGSLHVYQSYKNDLAVREEQKTRERIVSALALFAEKNNRMPCPANPLLTPTDNDFGKENLAGCPAAAGIVQGMVPVFALDLPFHLAADYFDRKMTYAVTASLTQTGGMTNAAAIRIVGPNGQERTAPFVLVNHGPDGKGARMLLSAAFSSACTGAAADVENCDGDDLFRDVPYATMTDATTANHYDDKVVYSLYAKETSVWVAAPTGAGMAIANKNDANVGIGITRPEEKLHVAGEILVDATDKAVEINASNQVKADNINSKNVVKAEEEITGNRVRASVFFYPED